jgi:hypothetical protein
LQGMGSALEQAKSLGEFMQQQDADKKKEMMDLVMKVPSAFKNLADEDKKQVESILGIKGLIDLLPEDYTEVSAGASLMDSKGNVIGTAPGGSGSSSGLTSNKIQSTIDGIVNQFDGEPIVKSYNVINEAVNMNKTLGQTPTDDMARVYNFAKVMDPNSVVRESEYATAQQYAQAVLQAYGLKINRVFTNSGFLTDEARKFLQDTLDKKLNASKLNYDNVYNEYNRKIEEARTGEISGSLANYGAAYNSPSGSSLRDQVIAAGYDYDQMVADGNSAESIKQATGL